MPRHQRLPAERTGRSASVTEVRSFPTRGKGKHRVLLALSSDLLAARDVREVMDLAVDAVTEHLKVPLVTLRLLDETGQWLILRAGAGIPQDAATVDRGPVEADVGISGHAARTRTPVIVRDHLKETRFRLKPEIVALGMRSALSVPMIVQDRVIGAMSAAAQDPGRFGAEEARFLWLVANYAALATERVKLHAAVQLRLTELTCLFEASAAFRNAASVGEMGPLLAQEAARLIPADAALVGLWDETRQRMRVLGVAGLPAQMLGREYGTDNGLMGQVIRTGTLYRSADLGADPLVGTGDPVAGLGPGRCAPLRTATGQVVGAVLVGRRRTTSAPAPSFNPEEERLLTTLAEMGATALQRVRAHEELEEAYIQVVLALANVVDARDTYTLDHSRRLAAWAEAVTRQMGSSDEEAQAIRWAALLHDIGKIAVPDAILQKPGRLTEEEWAVIRRHPEVGAGIVAPIKRLRAIAPIIRHHQERWDGTGYPRGLAREAIPLGARILAVADAYGAMVDNRVYRPARSHDEATAELRRCAGTQFDPRVVDVFCWMIEGAQVTRAGEAGGA